MADGTIRFFNHERNYGFIAADNGPDVFIHISAFDDQAADPRPCQRVTFEIEEAPRGPRSVNAHLLNVFRDIPEPSRSSQGGPRRDHPRGGRYDDSRGRGPRRERPMRFSRNDF